MTHTLHPEIENIIKDIRTYVYEYDKFQEVVLRQILEKHLLPTDPKDNEPNGNSSVTHVKPENVSHAFDDISLPNSVSKDNKPLPENPSMYVGDEGGQGGAEVHKYNTVEEQKQSIPNTSEVSKLYDEYSRGYSAGVRAARDKIDEIQS